MSDRDQILAGSYMGVIDTAALQPSVSVCSSSNREVMRIERDGKLVLAVEDAPEAAAVLMAEWDRLREHRHDHTGAVVSALVAARSMLKHMAEMSNYLSLPGTDVQMEFDDHIEQIDKALAPFGGAA